MGLRNSEACLALVGLPAGPPALFLARLLSHLLLWPTCLPCVVCCPSMRPSPLCHRPCLLTSRPGSLTEAGPPLASDSPPRPHGCELRVTTRVSQLLRAPSLLSALFPFSVSSSAPRDHRSTRPALPTKPPTPPTPPQLCAFAYCAAVAAEGSLLWHGVRGSGWVSVNPSSFHPSQPHSLCLHATQRPYALLPAPPGARGGREDSLPRPHCHVPALRERCVPKACHGHAHATLGLPSRPYIVGYPPSRGTFLACRLRF